MLVVDELALVQKPLRCSVVILPVWWDKDEWKKAFGPVSSVESSFEEPTKFALTMTHFSLSEQMDGKRGVSCNQSPASFTVFLKDG